MSTVATREVGPGGAEPARVPPPAAGAQGAERLPGGNGVLEDVLAKAPRENFPVALRLLPAQYRDHLLAIYAFARLVDDTGDEMAGGATERLRALDALEVELDRAFAGTADHPVFVRLAGTIERCGLDRKPFADLIEANRVDQGTSSYETFEDLLGYCRLSAEPVGRLVLGVFGQLGAERLRLSGLVCSGLQVVEHLQDVAEDAERGRLYLPREDWERVSLDPSCLSSWNRRDGAEAPAAFRRLVALEASRARTMLVEGSALVRLVDSWPARLALSGFVGGGLAQLDAIEAAGYDVLSTEVKATRSSVAWCALRLLVRAMAR